MNWHFVLQFLGAELGTSRRAHRLAERGIQLTVVDGAAHATNRVRRP